MRNHDDPASQNIMPIVKNIVLNYLRRGDEPERFITTSLEDLGLDSLEIVEISMEIEEQFDMDISDDCAETLGQKTLSDIVQLIKQQLLLKGQRIVECAF